MPFKDVFRADPEVAGDTGEPEALLSALSTGPVGLGDRVGRFDPVLAQRTCRADGLLIKPHTPIAVTDASMLAGPAFNNELLVAECYSDHPAGRWSYVVAMHGNPSDDEIDRVVAFDDLGVSEPDGDVIVWDFRERTATRLGADGQWRVRLGREEWTYLVLAPIFGQGFTVVGDTSKFVTAGDARIEVLPVPQGGADLIVKGAGETVTITGWSETTPSVDGTPVDHDTRRASGRSPSTCRAGAGPGSRCGPPGFDVRRCTVAVQPRTPKSGGSGQTSSSLLVRPLLAHQRLEPASLNGSGLSSSVSSPVSSQSRLRWRIRPCSRSSV